MKFFNTLVLCLGCISLSLYAKTPEGTVTGIKNDSDQMIHAFFIKKSEFPNVLKAKGWTAKAMELAQQIVNDTLKAAEQLEIKKDILDKYKKEKANLAVLKTTKETAKTAASQKKLDELKVAYTKAKTIAKNIKLTEKFVTIGKETIENLTNTINQVMPDIIVASIKTKDFAEQLWPKSSRAWTSLTSNLKGIKDVTFVVFGSDEKYPNLPDFTKHLFIRDFDTSKYNYVVYQGNGTVLFQKWGYKTDQTNPAVKTWALLEEKRKYYPPMHVKNGALVQDAADIRASLTAQDEAIDKQMEAAVTEPVKAEVSKTEEPKATPTPTTTPEPLKAEVPKTEEPKVIPTTPTTPETPKTEIKTEKPESTK